MKIKATLLAIAAIFLACTTSFAQQKEEESESTTLQFMKTSGFYGQGVL